MARPRKKGRKARTMTVTLSLTNPLAKTAHLELSRHGLASDVYQQFLIQNHAPSVPLERQIEVLQEELELLGVLRDEELEVVRAKWFARRKIIARLLEEKIGQNLKAQAGSVLQVAR